MEEQSSWICKNCHWYKGDSNNPYQGECRFSSPLARLVISTEIYPSSHQKEAYWPIVNIKDWCGNYTDKPVPAGGE